LTSCNKNERISLTDVKNWENLKGKYLVFNKDQSLFPTILEDGESMGYGKMSPDDKKPGVGIWATFDGGKFVFYYKLDSQTPILPFASRVDQGTDIIWNYSRDSFLIENDTSDWTWWTITTNDSLINFLSAQTISNTDK
jgi:hypothetical protein